MSVHVTCHSTQHSCMTIPAAAATNASAPLAMSAASVCSSKVCDTPPTEGTKSIAEGIPATASGDAARALGALPELLELNLVRGRGLVVAILLVVVEFVVVIVVVVIVFIVVIVVIVVFDVKVVLRGRRFPCRD